MFNYKMERAFSIFVVVTFVVISVTFCDGLQCQSPNGDPVDWYMAIKLPKLKSNWLDGSVYIYIDPIVSTWTYGNWITSEESAIGHTVAQMYAPNQTYNESLMWIVYNDEPTNGPVTFTKGHSKGIVIADNSSGLWLVHSVPKFPQLPYQNHNSYTYPNTGLKFGQSFLCMSLSAEELDKVGNQLINNEVLAYGSHFGGDLKETYPGLYNASLPHPIPRWDEDSVRLLSLNTTNDFQFLSVSKNRHFGKDLYENIIAKLAESNVFTETWLNTRDRFNSSCSTQYKAINIKSLVMKDIEGLHHVNYPSSKDHSKWVVTGKSSVHWICIGDINRSKFQTQRGGGTVCLKSTKIWNQFKKLISNVEKCKI